MKSKHLNTRIPSKLVMKNVNVTFTDEEHAELLKVKGKNSWHDFIISLGGAL